MPDVFKTRSLQRLQRETHKSDFCILLAHCLFPASTSNLQLIPWPIHWTNAAVSCSEKTAYLLAYPLRQINRDVPSIMAHCTKKNVLMCPIGDLPVEKTWGTIETGVHARSLRASKCWNSYCTDGFVWQMCSCCTLNPSHIMKWF